MLVLTRQRDQSIMIGDDIEIKVVSIGGCDVRLGITAPTKIAVHRKEVYDRIKAGKPPAAKDDFNQADSKKSGGMLVLTRELDETVMIGGDISIKITDIRDNKVRLGISAPQKISVHRKEVYDAIKAGQDPQITRKHRPRGSGPWKPSRGISGPTIVSVEPAPPGPQ